MKAKARLAGLGLGAALLLSCASLLWARAGGGQGYGSASSRSYGSYGWSGTSPGFGRYRRRPGLIDGYAYLLTRHPIKTLAATIFLLWLYYKLEAARVRKDWETSGLIVRGREKELESRVSAGLAALRERDPGYDESEFLRRAGHAFLSIQEAWSLSDLSKVRGFLSDGVHERFTRQLSALRDEGMRNRVSDVSLLESRCRGYRSGPHYDCVAVAFKASALDVTESLETGARLSGGRDEFEEVWTFLRRPGAKTLKKPGMIEGHCPNCGAGLLIADAARCGSCQSWVNSGEHDWVLAEITQGSEWRFPAFEGSLADVPGWSELRQADPALSVEALEDRASGVFWRWLDARRRRDPAPLRGVASPEFLRALELDGSFEHAPAVGAVETVAVELGAGSDRAHVQVLWEAADARRDAEGRARPDFRRRRADFLVLRRDSGALTDARAGLRAEHCSSCGAAPERPDAESCAYCRRPFNDGSRGWVLEAIVPHGQWRRPAESGARPLALIGTRWGDELSPLDAVGVLAAGLHADGRVDERERSFLLAYAKRRGVGDHDVRRLLTTPALDELRPSDGPQTEAMMRGLVRMSLADGHVSDEERALLAKVGRRAGLHELDFAQLIREERLELRERAVALLSEDRAA